LVYPLQKGVDAISAEEASIFTDGVLGSKPMKIHQPGFENALHGKKPRLFGDFFGRQIT